MAGETINIPVTPEIIEVKQSFLRRVSTGRINTTSSKEKVSTHYLRASTGSCHDFCKYGREHVFRTKERRASLKGIAVTLDECQKPLETATEFKRKKKPLIKKPVASPDLKILPPDPLNNNKKGTRLVKQEVLSPTKKVDVVMKVAGPLKKSSVSTANKIDVAKTAVSSKPKSDTLKAPSSASNPIRSLNGSKSSNIKEVEKNGVSKLNQKKVLVLHKVPVPTKPSVSKFASFVNRVATMNARKYRNLKGYSPLKNQTKVKKADPKPPTDENASEKTLYIVEQKPGNESLGPAGKGTPTSVSSRSSPSSPPLSPSSSVQEQDKNKDSESTLDDEDGFVSEYEEIENKDKIETSNGGYKRGPRRTTMKDPEGKDQARKLSFRRGKVIDPRSEYNSPRRLRFRQPRGLGDDQTGKDTKRKSFKKRAMDNGDRISSKAKPIEIVLRHKDANGKKDARLFNKVIKETASKLVQTNKSKVKALVGAFETVISLQEATYRPVKKTVDIEEIYIGVRLSGIEQDKQEVKNSGQRNLRLHKSKSLSKDRTQMQNWVSRQSSGQKRKEYDSTDGAEQLASVIGAAAAFAAIGSLEEGIQNQIKMGGEPQSQHTYSLNKSKSNMEATKGDPGKSSRRFSGQDTMKKSELRDLMMQERALENQNKANSTPVIRRIPTFADAYIGSKNLAKAVDLKPKSVPLPTVDTTIEITEDINPKGTLAVVPAIRESKSNAWENAEMAKIRSRYEKLNSRIVSWEEEKKKKARRQMDRVEAGLEGKRAKALQHYQSDILSIHQIAGRARTRSKEDKIKEEIKAMEKARKIRSTGKVPVTCFC